MSDANYQVVVLDWNGKTTKIYDGASFFQLRYSRVLNGIGSLALALPAIAGMNDIFKLDYLIEIQRTHPVTGLFVTEETYMVRSLERYRDEDDERFVVGAQSLNHLIKRKIVDPADDSLAPASGYSTKAGLAGRVLHDYVYDQMANSSVTRRVPNFDVNADVDFGSLVGFRLRYDNLYTIAQQIAAQGGVDFIVKRLTGNQLRCQIGIFGSDKTKGSNYPGAPFMMLATERGNLHNPSLKFNRTDEQTCVYLLGQGISTHRWLLVMGSDRLGDSPYNRVEYSEDYRVAKYRLASQLMIVGAKASLSKKRLGKEFTFAPDGQEPGNIYRSDWDIGDYITVSWDDQMIDFRLTEVELTVESGGEKIAVKVSQPDV